MYQIGDIPTVDSTIGTAHWLYQIARTLIIDLFVSLRYKFT